MFSCKEKNCDLYIVLTKIDLLNDNKIEEAIKEIKDAISEMQKKCKLTYNITYVPISTHTGVNLLIRNESLPDYKSLLELLDELKVNRVDNTKDPAKVIVIRRIDNHFGGKVVYAKLLSGSIKSSDSFVAYPSLREGRIDNIRINYQNISSADSGSIFTLLLSRSADTLDIDSGSILHINEKDVNTTSKAAKHITEIKIKLSNVWKSDISNNTKEVWTIEYKYYKMDFQLKDILGVYQNGVNMNNTTEVSVGRIAEVTLVPNTRDYYFEQAWNDKDYSDILRIKRLDKYGVGKLIDITYNI